MSSIEVSNKLFISFFKPSIRVMLDWKQIKECSIRMNVVGSTKGLTKWYLPWYIGKNKQEVEYTDLAAKPLALSQLPQSLPFLYVKRQKLINEIAKSYETSRPPIQLVVPTFALKKNRFLILDCSHRLSALYLSKVSFTILSFSILAPLDSCILPDLHHWV